jgi:hypothetical protein
VECEKSLSTFTSSEVRQGESGVDVNPCVRTHFPDSAPPLTRIFGPGTGSAWWSVDLDLEGNPRRERTFSLVTIVTYLLLALFCTEQ